MIHMPPALALIVAILGASAATAGATVVGASLLAVAVGIALGLLDGGPRDRGRHG